MHPTHLPQQHPALRSPCTLCSPSLWLHSSITLFCTDYLRKPSCNVPIGSVPSYTVSTMGGHAGGDGAREATLQSFIFALLVREDLLYQIIKIPGTSLRDGFPENKMHYFRFCPNEGGRALLKLNFCHILKRCIFGQIMSLFLSKCQ